MLGAGGPEARLPTAVLAARAERADAAEAAEAAAAAAAAPACADAGAVAAPPGWLGHALPAAARAPPPRPGGGAPPPMNAAAPRGEVLLYAGVIDFLQPFNARKRLEAALKGVARDARAVSVAEPAAYARRFLGAMERVFAAAG
jgi:1-phosphatidylinositol-4-phosphate 5-kinase